MPSRIGHGVLISITVIALLFASVITSYPETTTYIYDELNRLIQVIYEDGRMVIYNYDASGNRITLTQTPDTVPPTGTIIINSGAASTNNPAVTLTLSCSDNVVCSQMQFSNDNVTYSTPEAYGTTKSWTLSPGYVTKTVYVKFKDAAGNWSSAYNDTIDLIADSYTKSLLHMNGTDGSTTFTDSAVSGTHTWTAYGNAQIDTAQSKFGGASGLFDGNGDYIRSADSDDWAFGTGEFTVDFWVRFNSLPTVATNQRIFCQRIDGNHLQEMYVTMSGSSYYWNYYSYNGAYDVNVTGKLSPGLLTGVWYHIALLRTGNDFKIFQGGTQCGTTVTTSNSLTNFAAALDIGQYSLGSNYFNGWLDEFRISKGIARWTSNFTPPTNEYYP